MQNYDVVVIGGGPAGAVSALKCSQLGFKTLLVEKGASDRHKPCGGLVSKICIDILGDLGIWIPEDVICSPKTVGLFVVPPSGRSNGGLLGNYRLLNVNRDRFDELLRKAAESSGARILYEAEFVKFKKNADIKILIEVGGRAMNLSARYLIGADGTFSAVKRQIYNNVEVEYRAVQQEHWSEWSADGVFAENFCIFFKGDVTPTYGYVIPKDRHLIVGTGVPKRYHTSAPECINKFKEWLSREFFFDLVQLEKRDAATIPFSSPVCGEENAILVGDAAGFCNYVSGEGVRYAIESAIAGGEAVQQADHSLEALSSSYTPRVESIIKFIHRTYESAVSLLTTDEGREKFFKSEFARALQLFQ
jgi:geranylgeranyl reductase family protein